MDEEGQDCGACLKMLDAAAWNTYRRSLDRIVFPGYLQPCPRSEALYYFGRAIERPAELADAILQRLEQITR